MALKVELKEWLGEGNNATLPTLHCRAVGHSAPQLRFFAHHGLSFRETVASTFPHFMQQQSELRWVAEDSQRSGEYRYSTFYTGPPAFSTPEGPQGVG